MVNIVDIGGKTVPMRADGSTPYKFKALFNKDLLVELNNMDNLSPSGMTEILNELAFCMKCQCENPKSSLTDIGEDAFVDWLSEFDAMAITAAATAIMAVYTGQDAASSAAKKN